MTRGAGRTPDAGGAGGLLRRLRAAGLSPKRSLGQNFLHDPGLLRSLVDAADIGADEAIFEVGTGPGTLTAELARKARCVLSVEIDDRMARFARGELAGLDNVEIVVGDVLESKSRLRESVAERLRALGDFKWVSNLPYAVATPLIIAFLQAGFRWQRAVLTLQTEVAERLAAGPGETGYGAVSPLLWFWATARKLRPISAGSFWPRPRVESAAVRLDPRVAGPDPALWPAYQAWVRRLFQSRRKQVGKLLRPLVGEVGVEEFLRDFGVQGTERPESLPPEAFLLLARKFPGVFR